jgi:hypothetical protein
MIEKGCLMAGWIVSPSLLALRGSFDARFPNRDRASDGTIGDAAHREGVSGHNPDDTPGSRSEYVDADGVAEVRALDVDADLRDSRGATMWDVVDAIRRDTVARRRLRYIIFARQICSRNNGWVWAPYSGDNDHTKHAHFSGDPDTEADGSPWPVVLNLGGVMTLALDTRQFVGNYQGDPRYSPETQTLAGLWAGSYYYSIINFHNLRDLKAAAAADEQRDNAAVAAINALAAAIAAGGGSVDAAAIIAEVRAVGAHTHEMINTLQRENEELRGRLAAAYSAEGVPQGEPA